MSAAKVLCPVCGTPLHEGPQAVAVPKPGQRGRRPVYHKQCGDLQRTLNRLHAMIGKVPFDLSAESVSARQYVQGELRLISNQLCAAPVTPVELRYGLDLSSGDVYVVTNSKGDRRYVRWVEGEGIRWARLHDAVAACEELVTERCLFGTLAPALSPVKDATWLRWADSGSSQAPLHE